MSGDPRNFHVVPVFLGSPETANTTVDRHIFGLPNDANMVVDVVYVGMKTAIVPSDADGTLLADIEVVDAAGAKTDIGGAATAFDMEGLVADVESAVWKGVQQLNEGEGLNVEITNDSAAIDTASDGLIMSVGYRVRERSGE